MSRALGQSDGSQSFKAFSQETELLSRYGSFSGKMVLKGHSLVTLVKTHLCIHFSGLREMEL